MDEFSIRPARREEAGTIAELYLISSDGLAAYIWSRVAEPGEALAEAGARRYAREGVAFSYQNCLIAEAAAADSGSRIAGMIHSYPMLAPDPEPESDPVLRPYSELEDYGSLYVSGVALFAEFRGRGLGTRLMAEAERRARALSLARVSLICFEQNSRALALYRRLGFAEIMRRALVPHPMLHYRDGDALLLAKAV